MEPHVHSGGLWLLHLMAGLIIINFLMRSLAAHYRDKPWAQGLVYNI